MPNESSIADDYNTRGALDCGKCGVDSVRGGASARTRFLICFGAVLLGAALVPVDGAVSSLFARHKVGGDVKRELEMLQQFGAISSLVIVSVLIVLLDRGRVRSLADLFAAAGLTALGANILKMCIGRLRPRTAPLLDDPLTFCWPWTTSSLTRDGITTERHAWEFWNAGSLKLADLWSMPSSHTAAAVALAMFLLRQYPALRPFCIVMVVIVGCARVVLHAHFPSDVVIGAGLGWVVSSWVLSGGVGQRVLNLVRPVGPAQKRASVR